MDAAQHYDHYRAAKGREKNSAKGLRRQAKEKRDSAIADAKAAYRREKKIIAFNRDRNIQQLLGIVATASAPLLAAASPRQGVVPPPVAAAVVGSE